MKNAFRELVEHTENKWYNVDEMVPMIGLMLIGCGIEHAFGEQLVEMIVVMEEMDFIEINPDNTSFIKIKDVWYSA